ncbi:MAG TPA: DUF4402 domain-containing protein [Halanaerobiales bacterium]|nr:DUF4402 domain-containing protein [Halanaerobiales bacterium]
MINKKIFNPIFKMLLISIVVLFMVLILIPKEVSAADIYIEDFKYKIEAVDNGFILTDMEVWISNNTTDDRNIYEIKLTCDNGNYKLFPLEYILDEKVPSEGRVAVAVPLNDTWEITFPCEEVTVSVTQTDANSVNDATFTIDPSSYYSINKVNNLSFGAFAADYDQSMVITLWPDGTINVPTFHLGNQQAAKFIVSGLPSITFDVDLPITPIEIYKMDNNSESMIVDAFTTNLNGDTGTIESDYTTSFNVGADLSVSTDQPAGIYTGAFEVIVNYN